ncbi:MAG: ABC transporter ATP-binding protein [Nitrospirales bacterium]
MLIRLEKVYKIYQAGAVEVPALNGIDLLLQKGEFVAIIGQSGSGKTTLLDILGCLTRPTRGDYYLDGRLVSSLRDEELAFVRNRHMGFVFQTFHLLPRKTALQNVELPLQYAGVSARERRRRAEEVLCRVGLEDRMTRHPYQLSGGQQQRVAIARALVNQPTLLLADEPTGSLDTKSGAEILGILKDLHHRGQTVVLVTHEIELAQAAERIITLRDGLIVGDERRADAGRPFTFARDLLAGVPRDA